MQDILYNKKVYKYSVCVNMIKNRFKMEQKVFILTEEEFDNLLDYASTRDILRIKRILQEVYKREEESQKEEENANKKE